MLLEPLELRVGQAVTDTVDLVETLPGPVGLCRELALRRALGLPNPVELPRGLAVDRVLGLPPVGL